MTRRQSLPWLCWLLASAVLGGCSSPPDPRAELLGESYHLIDRFYLEPVRTDRISEASLDTLSKLDRDIAVEVKGRELLIKRGTKLVTRFPAPSPNDWHAWGETAAKATVAAAAASPAISALPDAALDQALLDGTVATLDQFSHYLSPEAARQSVIIEDEHPAYNTNDGGPGTGVSAVTLPRKPPQPPPSVQLRMDGRIAIVQIRRFTTSTSKLLRQQLSQAFGGGKATPQGIVLDLRDDPGGQIAAAAEVADLFLPRGIVVVLEGRDPWDRRVYASGFDGSIYETVPLAVLVNGRSISSAEVLAAALQGNGRALVVGSSTFGKGTAQRIIPLANGGELWLTSSYMRTPSGYLLQRHGVIPDICTGLSLSNVHAANAGSRTALLERFRSLTSRPRISLSEVEWAELRRSCPPSTAQSAAGSDLEIAKELVRNRATPLP